MPIARAHQDFDCTNLADFASISSGSNNTDCPLDDLEAMHGNTQTVGFKQRKEIEKCSLSPVLHFTFIYFILYLCMRINL